MGSTGASIGLVKCGRKTYPGLIKAKGIATNRLCINVTVNIFKLVEIRKMQDLYIIIQLTNDKQMKHDKLIYYCRPETPS